MKTFGKNIFLLCGFLIVCGVMNGQVRSVIIGVNGLHCAACSFGTEKSLRTLDYVQDIKMDLNKHEAEITFVPGKNIDLHALAQKVVDAGFSVRSVYVVVNFNNYSAKDNNIYPFQNSNFHFVDIKAQQLGNNTRLHVLSADFMSKPAYKKWKDKIMASTGASLPPGYARTEYFVTL